MKRLIGTLCACVLLVACQNADRKAVGPRDYGVFPYIMSVHNVLAFFEVVSKQLLNPKHFKDTIKINKLRPEVHTSGRRQAFFAPSFFRDMRVLAAWPPVAS